MQPCGTLHCTPQSALLQIHTFFQSEFSTKRDLVLPLFSFQYPVVSLSCLRLLHRIPVTSNLPAIFPSITSFRRPPKQEVANPVSVPSLYCTSDVPFLFGSMRYFFIFDMIGPTDLHPSPTPHLTYFHTSPIYLRSLRTSTVHFDNISSLLSNTNYYKIVKQLKSFKIITVATTCLGLHKPSSWSSQPVLR